MYPIEMINPDINDPVFLAWAAAWLDTEGSIGMRHNADRHCRGGQVLYRILLTVSQTVVDPLLLIQKAFRGHVGLNEKSGNPKPIYQFTIHSRAALEMLKLVRPFLIVKTKQADLAIEAATIISSKRYNRFHSRPKEVTEYLEKLKNQLHELNGWSPERRARSVQDGKRRGPKRLDKWAKNFDACIKCGRTSIIHAGHGLCISCNAKRWRQERGIKARRSQVANQWSATRDSCTICNEFNSPHWALGMCKKCYQKEWEKNHRISSNLSSRDTNDPILS